MKNNLIIPKSDIKKLEKARLDLHEYLDGLDMGIPKVRELYTGTR